VVAVGVGEDQAGTKEGLTDAGELDRLIAGS